MWRFRPTHGRNVARLRAAIDGLPVPTRHAMLVGLHANRIVIGAYTTRSGGICPMLAAHRCGGRTDFRDFARAWDAIASPKRPRFAQRHELDLLRALLEESLADWGENRDLRAAREAADRAPSRNTRFQLRS
jgi:hypothetical protein